ncbi:hypothetical protein ES705_42646 [subsurface metagenome]
MVKMSKGPFMEFLRVAVTETAANIYTEEQVQTPTSKTENMAMLIHSIEMDPNRIEAVAPSNGDYTQMQVTDRSQTGFKQVSRPGVLASVSLTTVLNAVYNNLSIIGKTSYKFDPPLLYPKAQIYCAINSQGTDLVATGHFRIGYTLEKVSREDFISALVE